MVHASDAAVGTVTVPRGAIPRDLYDLDPARMLQYGFALYRRALARSSVLARLQRHELPREEMLRLSDKAFERYLTRTRQLIQHELLKDVAATLVEEGISLDDYELLQAQRICELYEAVLAKYEVNPSSPEGIFARKVREAAFTYSEGMLAAKRDKDDDKLTAWDVRLQGSKAKDLLAGAIGFLRGGGAVIGVTGLASLVAYIAVHSFPELPAQTGMLAQVGAGVFSFSITVFVLLFLSGRGIESVDNRWRLAIREATDRQDTAIDRAREVALAIGLEAWQGLTGADYDVELGLIPQLRRPTRAKVSRFDGPEPLTFFGRIRKYITHRGEFLQALRETEARIRQKRVRPPRT